jgi:antitoxin component of RelBE/YafQ-DinJ toxin-antitoxin module
MNNDNKTAYIMVRVSQEFKDEVNDFCKENCINLSEFIRKFLQDNITNKE